MKEDIMVMLDLENELTKVLNSVDWKDIRYTVPGSIEKILEVQAGITNTLGKINKTITLIKDRSNENQEAEEDNGTDETGEEI